MSREKPQLKLADGDPMMFAASSFIYDAVKTSQSDYPEIERQTRRLKRLLQCAFTAGCDAVQQETYMETFERQNRFGHWPHMFLNLSEDEQE